MYRIEIYDGSRHPALEPHLVFTATSEHEARRIAARALGHSSLRGASTWEGLHGGMVYQFGPRTEQNGYDYAVIVGDEED